MSKRILLVASLDIELFKLKNLRRNMKINNINQHVWESVQQRLEDKLLQLNNKT